MADRSTPTSPDGSRALRIAAGAVLIATACGAFFGYHRITGVVEGRDVLAHVTFFLVSFADIPAEPMWTRFAEVVGPNHGPLLRLVTLPGWFAWGATPTGLSLANLLAFFALCWIAAVAMKRARIDPAWALVFGLVLLSDRLGHKLFFRYSIDAVYAAAAMVSFAVLVVRPNRRPASLPVIASVCLVGLLARLTVGLYLIAPLAYQAVLYVRSWKGGDPDDRRAMRGRAGAWALAGALAVCAAVDYVPKIDFFFTILPNHPDFFLDNTRYVSGVWTSANWTWFFAHVGEALSPGVLAACVPLAAFGWWRGFRGRRIAVAAFVLVPLVPYSLIMGTRQIEYVGPSIVVFVLLAACGVAMVRRAAIRGALLALLLAVSLPGVWQIVGLPPLGSLQRSAAVDRLASTLYAGAPGSIADRPEWIGRESEARELAGVLWASGARRIAIVDRFPEPHIPFQARGLLDPLVADRPADAVVESIEDPARLAAERWDAVLVAVGEGTDPHPAPPAELTDGYRPAVSLPLYEGMTARIDLPREGGRPESIR